MTQAPEGAPLVLFVTLAMNQTRFFKAVGDCLEEQGYQTAYVCFHERSHEWLAATGTRTFNVFELQPLDPASVSLDRFKVDQLNFLLEHEKAAYELFDSDQLLQKFKGHLHAMAAVFDDLFHGGANRIHLVQELGGFLSVLAAYYVARAGGVDNWFIEPSFFRGRVFFVKNSFSACPVRGPEEVPVLPEVSEYLEKTIKEQSMVIPEKDRHHYRGVAAKLADTRNLRRLVEKVWDKCVLGKREEFEHVGSHVRRHLRMFFNNFRFRSRYRALAEAGRFVYYPLHVPADFALTIRSPEYLDQYALVDYLCRAVPHTHRVAIKEHPALIGAVSYSRMADLLGRHDNLVLLDPHINNYEVLHAADAVITVNSKSGAEALLLGKPVLVLGDAFYRPCQLAQTVDRLADLPRALDQVLRGGRTDGRSGIHTYFQNIWNLSHRGELYDLSPANVAVFAGSLYSVLAGGRIETGWPTKA